MLDKDFLKNAKQVEYDNFERYLVLRIPCDTYKWGTPTFLYNIHEDHPDYSKTMAIISENK